MKIDDVNKEYNRLQSLFKDVDETKKELVDELLKKAAFLKVQLDELQNTLMTYGSLLFSSKGNVKQSPVLKTYLSTLGVYQNLIKTLNSILGKNVSEDEDEFDKFLKGIEV